MRCTVGGAGQGADGHQLVATRGRGRGPPHAHLLDAVVAHRSTRGTSSGASLGRRTVHLLTLTTLTAHTARAHDIGVQLLDAYFADEVVREYAVAKLCQVLLLCLAAHPRQLFSEAEINACTRVYSSRWTSCRPIFPSSHRSSNTNPTTIQVPHTRTHHRMRMHFLTFRFVSRRLQHWRVSCWLLPSGIDRRSATSFSGIFRPSCKYAFVVVLCCAVCRVVCVCVLCHVCGVSGMAWCEQLGQMVTASRRGVMMLRRFLISANAIPCCWRSTCADAVNSGRASSSRWRCPPSWAASPTS